MSQRRAERLMNLHIMLLGARRFATKEAIRRACYPDYSQDAGGDDAFERAFERDKDALRALGAIIEVGNCDPLFDDEVGYRIPTEQTSLPAVRFEADEAAVLGVAAQVWEQATLARATTRALDKLKADGVEVDPSRLSVLTPAITAVEPTFEALWEAVEKRRVVTFDYRRANDVNPTKRTLQPWGLVRSSARWYVVGHDTDRGQERVFRLSRIIGAVRAKGRQGAYEVPAGVDVREVAARLAPTSPLISAEVLVRKGTALDLRRRAESIVGHDEVWDLLVIDAAEQTLVAEVLAHGEDAVVLSPSSLRAAVIAALTQVAEATS